MIDFQVERLSWHEVRKRVEEFRSKHKDAQQIPVGIEEVIEFDLRIKINPIIGLKQEVEVEAFLSHDLTEIWVDYHAYMKNHLHKRNRFTLAEEVGHFVLHKLLYTQGVKYDDYKEFVSDIRNMDEDKLDWIERQAREFAGRLLVPVDALIEKIKENEKAIKTFYEKFEKDEESMVTAIERVSKIICDEFEVSWQVIRARIDKEGLKYLFDL